LVLNVFISLMPGISAAAHFGGGAVGLITAALLHYHRFGTGPGRWLALIGAFLVPVLCVGALVYATRAGPVMSAARERIEVGRLNEEVLPAVLTARKEAHKAYANEAEPLLGKNWQRRDPAAVEKAVAALAEGRAKLKQALDVLEKSGPYTSPTGRQ